MSLCSIQVRFVFHFEDIAFTDLDNLLTAELLTQVGQSICVSRTLIANTWLRNHWHLLPRHDYESTHLLNLLRFFILLSLAGFGFDVARRLMIFMVRTMRRGQTFFQYCMF